MVIHARNYWQEDAICFLSLWKVEWITENQSRKYYSRNTPTSKEHYVRLSGRFSPHANEIPPCWRNCSLTKGQTALTDYRHGKKETKKRGYPVLTGISSLTWKKGGYLLSRFAGSTIGVSGLNFSVRNGKRWDTAAIATIISDSGTHTAQHYIGKRRIIPLTSNQQNIKNKPECTWKNTHAKKSTAYQTKAFGLLVVLGFDVAVFTPAPYPRHRLWRPS